MKVASAVSLLVVGSANAFAPSKLSSSRVVSTSTNAAIDDLKDVAAKANPVLKVCLYVCVCMCVFVCFGLLKCMHLVSYRAIYHLVRKTINPASGVQCVIYSSHNNHIMYDTVVKSSISNSCSSFQTLFLISTLTPLVLLDKNSGEQLRMKQVSSVPLPKKAIPTLYH
jgi:beta-lactamase regulating signal transducer with metallopeptidase domain